VVNVYKMAGVTLEGCDEVVTWSSTAISVIFHRSQSGNITGSASGESYKEFVGVRKGVTWTWAAPSMEARSLISAL
jgi:hypothetical protein